MSTSEETRQRALVISATTLVPVGLAVTIIIVAFAMKTWIDSQFTDLRTDIAQLRFQMERYEDAMKTKTADRWTSTNMRLWVTEFRRRNPVLDIPRVGDVLEGR